MTSCFIECPPLIWDPHHLLDSRAADQISDGDPHWAVDHAAKKTWIDIDMLLTSPTITDALKATRARRSDLDSDG